MLQPTSRPVRRNQDKNFGDIGHYAVGTSNLIATSSLDKRVNSDLWASSAQKPMLYYAVGGQVEEHDMGAGHRRSLADLQKLDYTNYVKR
jgi:hypothetical protein